MTLLAPPATRTVTFLTTNATAGVSIAQTRDITVAPVNDVPDVTATVADLAYTENDGAIAIDTGLTVTDLDDTNLASATIQITNNYNTGEDVLAFSTQLGITGSFNATNGMLTLTGATTVANYQTALRALSLTPTPLRTLPPLLEQSPSSPPMPPPVSRWLKPVTLLSHRLMTCLM